MQLQETGGGRSGALTSVPRPQSRAQQVFPALEPPIPAEPARPARRGVSKLLQISLGLNALLAVILTLG